MKDFGDCVETMAGFTYAMFLASLMIILIFEQDMSCMTHMCACCAFNSIYNSIYDFI